MLKKLYAQCVAWVTQFRNKIRTDAFFAVRFQLIGLYLVIGALIFMFIGWVLGSLTLRNVYDVALVQNGHPVEVAFAIYHHQIAQRRLVMAVLFALSAYFFTEFALIPVKKSADIQKRFIAIVSHELRTPLTIMKNASEVALRNPAALTPEKSERLIRSNLEEINRLSETVQFLLTFSLLRTQKRIPEMQPVSLAGVVTKIMSLLENESRERDVHLVHETESSGMVMGNTIALEGLVTNLIKNAISHTPPEGTVTVKIQEGKSFVRLHVSDTGSGISKKDIRYIFEPFYRGTNEERNEGTHKGFGLGLSIVKEVAEFHQARIAIETKEGEGTHFVVTFPK
jgi:signal transduction histidine kinase